MTGVKVGWAVNVGREVRVGTTVSVGCGVRVGWAVAVGKAANVLSIPAATSRAMVAWIASSGGPQAVKPENMKPRRIIEMIRRTNIGELELLGLRESRGLRCKAWCVVRQVLWTRTTHHVSRHA